MTQAREKKKRPAQAPPAQATAEPPLLRVSAGCKESMAIHTDMDLRECPSPPPTPLLGGQQPGLFLACRPGSPFRNRGRSGVPQASLRRPLLASNPLTRLAVSNYEQGEAWWGEASRKLAGSFPDTRRWDGLRFWCLGPWLVNFSAYESGLASLASEHCIVIIIEVNARESRPRAGEESYDAYENKGFVLRVHPTGSVQCPASETVSLSAIAARTFVSLLLSQA